MSLLRVDQIANAAGTGATSFTNGLTSTTASLTGGLTVTSGDVNQTALDYFEQITFTATFTQSGGYSQTPTIKVTRIGKQVTIELPTFGATTTATAPISSGATDVPARFRPAIAFSGFLIYQSAGVSNTPGGLTISTGGQINLYTTIGQNNFTSGNANSGPGDGTRTQSFTYKVA